MSKLIDIPVVVESGSKYQTDQGFSAIKDGIKSKQETHERLPKPKWLRVVGHTSDKYKMVKAEVDKHRLATVCEEAKCPNIGECWSHGTATIMLMGAVCTRACRFCSVDTGNPRGWLDKEEPEKAAHSVEVMNLDYVVLTSVNRDDLADGGAQHYADAIRAIKQRCPKTKVEALTPDFQGDEQAVATLLDSGVDVFAQNVETVERLTHPVRDNRAGYWQTINVLSYAKQYRPDVLTKTSLMLGIGETDDELIECMKDLRANHVDILTLGQYLQPTRNHLPDASRWAVSIGGHYQAKPELGFDVGYTYLWAASKPTINKTVNFGASTYNINARADAHAHLIGGQVVLKMDGVDEKPAMK